MPPQLSVEMTGDEVKLFKSLQKIIGQQKRMETGFAGVGKQSKRAGDQAKESFGSRAATRLAGFAVGVASISSATRFATSMMRDFERQTISAMGQTRKLADVRRSLSQISNQSPTQLSGMKDRADTAAIRFGVERDVAAQFLFDAKSSGFEGDFERLLELHPVATPESMATVASKGPQMFRREGLTPMQSINAVLRASEKSDKPFEAIAAALPQAASGASANDAGAAETMAALGQLSFINRSPEMAATLISGFGQKASQDDQLKGLGLIKAVEALQGMSEADRRKFIGSNQELDKAYRQLSEQLPQIKAEQQRVQSAIDLSGNPETSLIHGNLEARLAQENTRNMILADKMRIRREVAEERRMASRGFRNQVVQDRVIGDMLMDPNATHADRFLAESGMSFTESIGFDDRFIEGTGRQLGRTTQRMRGIMGGDPGDVAQDVLRELQSINRGTSDMRSLIERQGKPANLTTPDADK